MMWPGSVQTVIVAGSAAGYTSVTDSMDVTDDDVPALTVSIALGTISETDAPGTAVATVTRNTPTDRDLTVTVASMDPSEILFGQSSLGSGVIAEVEANNSLAAAQSIDGQWSLALDPDIGDSSANTSTTIPHVTISGTGDGTFDYYAFTVPAAGVRGIFDIDYVPRGLPIRRVSTRKSSSIRRWALLLGGNDDSFFTGAGAGGSTFSTDSFLEYTFTSPGLYVIGVGRFNVHGQCWRHYRLGSR